MQGGIEQQGWTSRYRWTICALIFFAVTINYLDRSLFANLVPFFEQDLRLGPTDLALINVSFTLPYGIAMPFVGRWIDRIGLRRGLAGTFLLWNLASIGHAIVQGLGGFMGFRLLLGLGESGMYPSGVKTVTEWFPVRERSTATGFFNAGANMGAVAAPLIGVWIAKNYGWRECFVITGLLGMIWLIFWQKIYLPPRQHPKVAPAELELIEGDQQEEHERIDYAQLFGLRPVYVLSIAKALTDAPWWFYLFWLPKCLIDVFHTSTTFMAWALAFVYVVADLGSIAGGWFSSRLIGRGRSVGSARRIAMLACAISVVPVIAVGYLADRPEVAGIPSVYWAILLIAIAAGAHQGWSSNLFTLISDTTPKPGIAMAVGVINGFAMVGTSAMQFFVGAVVAATSSYKLPFIVAGSLYLVAWVVLQILLPQVKQFSPNKRVNLAYVGAGAAALLGGLLVLQYFTNRPPYASMRDYLAKRGDQIKATGDPIEGPAAKVGWMDARWYVWRVEGDKTKTDLVKLDTRGSAFVESKGEKAAHYEGPPVSEVERLGQK